MTTIPPQGVASNPLGMPPSSDPVAAMTKAHDMAAAIFKKTGEGIKHLQTMNGALAKLAAMGDTITEEDVVKAASDLVSKGTHSANEMASILADMPPGKGIAAWIAGHLQANIVTTQKLAQMHTLARHEMGASGLRLMQQLGAGGPLGGASPNG